MLNYRGRPESTTPALEPATINDILNHNCRQREKGPIVSLITPRQRMTQRCPLNLRFGRWGKKPPSSSPADHSSFNRAADMYYPIDGGFH